MENLTEQQEKEFEEFEAERYLEGQAGVGRYPEVMREQDRLMENSRWEEEYGLDC